MRRVEGARLGELFQLRDIGGGERRGACEDAHVPRRAVHNQVRSRILDTTREEGAARGLHHLRGIHRELADRHRYREHTAFVQQSEEALYRFDREGKLAGLGLTEKIRGQVDNVVAPGTAQVPRRLLAEAQPRTLGIGAGADTIEQHISRLQRFDRRCTHDPRLLNTEAATRTNEQCARLRAQRVRQCIQHAFHITRIEAVIRRQRCDAIAVVVQAKGARRALGAKRLKVVGEIGVETLGEVIENRKITAR